MSALDGGDLLADLVGWLRPAWHADAACKEHPGLSWFAGRGESIDEQRAVCGRCLVVVECRAAGAREDFGMWGGDSAKQRKVAARGGGHHVGPTRRTMERLEVIRAMRVRGASSAQIAVRLGISLEALKSIELRHAA